MQILWAGGEDLDFPYIGFAGFTTTGGKFRTGWTRGSMNMGSNNGINQTKGYVFPGGAVTTAWLSFIGQFPQAPGFVNSKIVGFGQFSTFNGLFIGADSTGNKVALYKFDGTTPTLLATEAGASLVIGPLIRFDMQVVNYGASATVNIFVNFVPIINFVGNVAVAGMTNMDSVTLAQYQTNNPPFYSEIFVTDSDSRAITGLQTMALTGQGTTNNWNNNTFSNINQTAMTDASPTSVNTTAQNQQYNMTDGLLTAYSVIGMVISARMAKTAASVPSQIKLGYNSGGTVAFGTGAAKTPALGFGPQAQIDMVNPVTGVAFQQSEINALQLNLQSA